MGRWVRWGGEGERSSASEADEYLQVVGRPPSAGTLPAQLYYSLLTAHTTHHSLLRYASCPKCTKKVVGDEVNGCNCEACGWSGTECSYRYMCALVAMDSTGSQWLTAFNDQATALLGKTADVLKKIKDESKSEFEEVARVAQPLHTQAPPRCLH